MSDAASRLMFKCLLCDNECESVSHVLWECPACSSLRDNFLVALQETLGDEFEHFQALRRRPLCWEVSCGRISMVLCLTLLRVMCGS